MKRIIVIVLCSLFLCTCGMTTSADAFLLKVGYSGDDVEALQLDLISLGYLDNQCKLGYFGESTQNAVIEFQEDNGLVNDGIAGNKTLTVIEDRSVCVDFNKKYRLGDSGEEIRAVQLLLVERGYIGSFSVSGVFGKITENAVISFQNDNGLKADGIVGKNTMLELIGAQVIDSIIQDCDEPNITYLNKLYNTLTEDHKADIYLLSQLITAESGNEPYIGQVAVGSVVMNRMEHDKQTMTEVIFRKNAFSVAKDGKINKIPTEQCKYAAIQAYFGAKPVSTARFFNGKHITTSWAATHCQLYKIIGNHAFYV